MKQLLLNFFLLISFFTYSQYQVFTENGKQGLKNDLGEIIIKPKYEKLGWADGSQRVFDGIIGFSKHQKWGLISIKGNEITSNDYYSVIPLGNGLFKATNKQDGSHLHYCGVINENGKVIVSFNYYDVSYENGKFIVTDFRDFKTGIIDAKENEIIPKKYDSISVSNYLIIAKKQSQVDIFSKEGSLLLNDLNNVIQKSDGWICEKNGRKGWMNEKGEVIHPINYKEIKGYSGGLQLEDFPQWEIYKKQQKVFELKCDSIHYGKHIWIAYLNGKQHFIDKQYQLIATKYRFNQSVENLLIVTNSADEKWSVIDINGNVIISGYEYIEHRGSHFIGRKNGRWDLFSIRGIKRNSKPFKKMAFGESDLLIAKRNGLWGLVDFSGDVMTGFKYDSIISSGENYIIKEFGSWGVMDKFSTWVVLPKYDSIFLNKKLAFAKKGSDFFIYHTNNCIDTIQAKPVSKMGDFTLVNDSGFMGLMDGMGSYMLLPLYEKIKYVAPYFVAYTDKYAVSIDEFGRKIIKAKDEVENIERTSEGLTMIQKNEMWGLSDNRGRLRIANRYDSVGLFSENMVGIKLLGKWGFINKSEEIIIQPKYQSVGRFVKGISIVKKDNYWGLVDKSGKEVLKVKWLVIKCLEMGNYIFQSLNGKYGIANSSGKILFSPNFEQVIDRSDKIVVKQGNKKGVIRVNGKQLFPIIYDNVKVYEDFVLVEN